MQRSKWKWVEIAGLLPCSLVLAPLIAFGLLAMVLVAGQWATNTSQPGAVRMAGLSLGASVLLLMAAALAGLVGTWAAVLMGADRLRQKPRQRWAVVGCLVLGMVAAGSWLAWMASQRHGKELLDAGGWVVWVVLLVPPLAVGARQIYLLLRANH